MDWRILESVDVRMWWSNGFVVASTVHDGHNISVKKIEELFSYVIATKGIFEGEVELVVQFDALVTVV